MAEKLYFIKINPVAAKINLYNKLCREEDTVLSFLKEDKKTSLELIRKKTQKNIESLSKEELLGIFEWFGHQYNSDPEEIKTQLFIHGIEIFYEISDSSEVRLFHQIMSDYEKHSQVNLGYMQDSEEFNQFLIYGIFFSELMNDNQTENFHLDFLKSNCKNLYSFAEAEFHQKKSEGNLKPEMHHHFSELYDCTKFYKGNIVRLHSF